MVSFYAAPPGSWLSAADLGAGAVEQRPLPGDAGSPCLTLYGPSVRRARLGGVDAGGPGGSATSARARISRALLACGGVEEALAVLEGEAAEFDAFHCTLAVHRLARLARRARAAEVVGHPQWPAFVEKLRGAVRDGEPRQVASVVWAFANLQAKDAQILDAAADRCLRRQAAEWDTMSLSLVPQAFALLHARHPALLSSVASQLRRETSAVWGPGDLTRVVWACARLQHRDDALFRDASCKALSRLPEFPAGVLTQAIWAFATAGPPEVASHFFPRAAESMPGAALSAYTTAHLAMVVWAFAATQFRPVELLEEIGEAVPGKPKYNSQDVTMIAWSYATLLAPQRRVFEFLARAAVRSVGSFNPQDLANAAWAFATTGEHAPDMFDAIGDEACARVSEFSCQHVAMLLWAFVTIRHRHDRLFGVVGGCARVDRGSWHSAKLLAYALAGLPALGARLGSAETTSRVAAEIVEAWLHRRQTGVSEEDDVHTVHDAVFPWVDAAVAGWREVEEALSVQRQRLVALERSAVFAAILPPAPSAMDTPTVREYQAAVQAIGVRGLGSVHTWRFLRGVGLARADPQLAHLARKARARAQRHRLGQATGRGERANWCFWRGQVRARSGPGGERRSVEEPGRLQSSAVLGYREDCAGLVAVMMSHDRVNHRAWDAEFRAMARVAAAARSLLAGRALSEASALLADGASEASAAPGSLGGDGEAGAEGRLEIHMTEVPCLSCVCAMAQFRRRFPGVRVEVSWDGMPAAD